MGATSRLPARPRGIALLMALAVVMLLTVFMSEYFFATGLELRAMTTYREAQQARSLAKAVFKVVQIGMFQDEVDFFNGYRQVAELLQFAAVPWADGLLISLEIAPQDHLYNLNELWNLQQGEDKDQGRWNLFRNVMEEVERPGLLADSPSETLPAEEIEEFYAAFYDWIDADDEQYTQFPAILGAEADTYFLGKPEYAIKNGMIDRLTEIRIVRGVRDSRISWREWETRFTALPRSGEGGFFNPEHINVNLATQAEIIAFLQHRHMDPALIESQAYRPIQEGINRYVDDAEQIAERFAPEEGDREVFDKATLTQALREIGFDDIYGVTYLFTTINQYYRISVVTEVNDVQARLQAMLHVQRNESDRTGSIVNVLWATLD